MPRLPLITESEATPAQAALLNGARRLTGGVSDLTRALAHSPAVARMLLPFLATLQRRGMTAASERHKELAILQTSRMNGCAG